MSKKILSYFVAFIVLVAAVRVLGLEQGYTKHNRPWMTGGVGEEERAHMIEDWERYNLWIVTVTKSQGFYTANTNVKVTGLNGLLVAEFVADGPWIFIDLFPGHYTVSIIDAYGNAQSRELVVRNLMKGHKLVFVFPDSLRTK